MKKVLLLPMLLLEAAYIACDCIRFRRLANVIVEAMDFLDRKLVTKKGK